MTETLEKPVKKTGGMRPWLKVVLFASLAMNLAVAGVVVGAAVKYGPRDGHRPPRLDRVVGPYTQALSRQDRRAIGVRMREEYSRNRPSRTEIRAEFATVLRALRAQPYDPAQVEAILTRQLQVGSERQELGQRLLIERLTNMSDSERAVFADRLEEGLEHHHSRPRPERD
ncbi:periplasmic heavy metal sensor [Thalassovita sp.]|uniref:periplasmic heavy metal sensor n=1 Tax=Thalassovita sp. TaxID=1979401 RepID=UPI0028820090|nr:periplasmic heavy metal sensor [Thalassovita sp.]MDF1801946.1 periplasmic heavy metal sensor [Thalassovita sp.]